MVDDDFNDCAWILIPVVQVFDRVADICLKVFSEQFQVIIQYP
jgi:hypothetical protein